MSKSAYGPFNQIDFPATSRLPAVSAFEAIMPVRLQIEDVRNAVKTTIPHDLATGFARNGADSESLLTFEPTPTLRIVRELGLETALNPVQEKKDFNRREFTIAALAEHGVAGAQVLYYLSMGELQEYSVAGKPVGSKDVAELFASVNQIDRPNEYYYRNHSGNGDCNSYAIDQTFAADFLSGLAERQSGNKAPDSELKMLQQIFEASTHKEHTQSGSYIIECSPGTQSAIEASRQTIKIGEKILECYSLAATHELPTGDSLSLGVQVKPSWRNYRTYPSARFSMTVTDRAGSPSSPMDRAATFNSLLNTYRDHPEIFFSSLAKAAECLATTDAIKSDR